MVACGVERFFDIAKGLPPNRGGAAAACGESCFESTSKRRELTTPSEVRSRDSGGVRDRASGTGVSTAIISIDPTLSFCARAPVLDHLTMADGDMSASEEVNLGARR